MRTATALILIVSLVLVKCNNINDADPSPRNTFVKFYEAPYSLSSASIEEIPGGYMILGNLSVRQTDTAFVQTVLIETDKVGNRIGDFHLFNGGTGKSFKPILSSGALSGYIVVGDSTFIDPEAEQAANVSITSLRVLVIRNDFSVIKKAYIADKIPLSQAHPVKIDFFGGAVNLTPNGNAIVLGTFKEGQINQQASPEKQLLFSLDNNQDSTWFKTYDLLTDTYSNAKSVHYLDGNIFWATAIADVQGDFTSSYLAIPKVSEASVFKNFNPFGQTSTQLLLPQDIQPAKDPGSGFGVIGTYSQTTDGAQSNIFFLRVNTDGNVIPGSDRYFDGIESFKKDSLDVFKNNSSIVDEGSAIIATKDGGFVLAGSFNTTPNKGNGGKDILLIKVTGQGNMVWIKTFGGSGNETVSAIREAADGGILICGANEIGLYSTVFLMKTDKNGEMKN